MSTSEPLFIDDGERSPHRVLVGISRIKTYEKDIREWNEPSWTGEMNMIWSVPFRHAFPRTASDSPCRGHCGRGRGSEKRAPYLVALDGGIRTDFRYGSSRVTLDRAVAVCERAMPHSAARSEACSKQASSGASVAQHDPARLWEDRGPYPGMAPTGGARLCAQR